MLSGGWNTGIRPAQKGTRGAGVSPAAMLPGSAGVSAGGPYGDLISQRRSSTSRWYHFDALGSTDRLTGADGSATDTYIYKAFGPLAASTGSTTNPFLYVGELGYYDQGSGPLYVRARWLRPTTGSWLSVDPIEGQPRYRYAGSCPVASVDPSGLAWIDPDWCDRQDPGAGHTKTYGGWIGHIIESWLKLQVKGKMGAELAPKFYDVVTTDSWTIRCETRGEGGGCAHLGYSKYLAVTVEDESTVWVCVDNWNWDQIEKNRIKRVALGGTMIHEFVHAALWDHYYRHEGWGGATDASYSEWTERAAYSCHPGRFHEEYGADYEALRKCFREGHKPYEICAHCCGWIPRPPWFSEPSEHLTCGDACACWCEGEPGTDAGGWNWHPRTSKGRTHRFPSPCVNNTE